MELSERDENLAGSVRQGISYPTGLDLGVIADAQDWFTPEETEEVEGDAR